MNRRMSVHRARLELLHEMPSSSSDFDGTPTPRSWVARMTKRPTPTGDGKSASCVEVRNEGPSVTDRTNCYDDDIANPADLPDPSNDTEPSTPSGTPADGRADLTNIALTPLA